MPTGVGGGRFTNWWQGIKQSLADRVRETQTLNAGGNLAQIDQQLGQVYAALKGNSLGETGTGLGTNGLLSDSIGAANIASSAVYAVLDSPNNLAALAAALVAAPNEAVNDIEVSVPGGVSGNAKVSALMSYAGVVGSSLLGACLLRSQWNVNILLQFETDDSDGNAPEALEFGLADVGAKTSALETDIHMLQRLYPAAGWTAGYAGSPFCGCFSVDAGGAVIHYYYYPPSLTLSQLYHAFDYTPTSGVPMRNVIVDLLNILSKGPFVWG